MNTKVVLITGCSSGIGKALAFECKKHNCRVFASARNVSKLDEAGIEIVHLDITDAESVEVRKKSDKMIKYLCLYLKKAVATVLKQAGRIDILVNNADLSSWN
jgi:NADP-dependent 3-hydroxy acid dehydrogenase YdfG